MLLLSVVFVCQGSEFQGLGFGGLRVLGLGH